MKQKDKGHSLEYQKNRLSDYCEKFEFNNYKFYDDGGYSGKDENRPAYKRMLKDIRNKSISKIILVSKSVIIFKKSKEGKMIKQDYCTKCGKYCTKKSNNKSDCCNATVSKKV